MKILGGTPGTQIKIPSPTFVFRINSVSKKVKTAKIGANLRSAAVRPILPRHAILGNFVANIFAENTPFWAPVSRERRGLAPCGLFCLVHGRTAYLPVVEARPPFWGTTPKKFPTNCKIPEKIRSSLKFCGGTPVTNVKLGVGGRHFRVNWPSSGVTTTKIGPNLRPVLTPPILPRNSGPMGATPLPPLFACS